MINQIRLIHAAWREDPQCSLQSSKCYWLKTQQSRSRAHTLLQQSVFTLSQNKDRVWVDHAFPRTVTIWCFIRTVNVIISTFLLTSQAERIAPHMIFWPLTPPTPPRLKPTANCLYPTTLLPLVWPVQQKFACTEHTALTCCQLYSSMYVLRLREMQ